MPHFNLTPRAKADLHKIWNYTYDVWGEDQADKYVTALYDRFGWLAENPKSATHRKDIHQGYYCFPHQKHLVFFLCFDSYIDIIGVPHQSMDIINYFDTE